MELWTLSLIALFHFNFTMAEWNPNSALVLIDIGEIGYRMGFPPSVRIDNFGNKVYHNTRYQLTRIFTYCPDPIHSAIYPNCIYPTPSSPFSPQYYTYTDRHDEVCHAPVPYLNTNTSGQNQTHTHCVYNERSGLIHRFVYLRCMRNSDPSERSEETQIYEVCYQSDQQQMILARYTITVPHLLNNNLLADEQNYPFQDHLIPNELYYLNPQYRPRSVLPPEWLAFALQRKTLFDDMNMAPMHVELIAGWELLMRNLKLRLSRMNGPIHVTAGLYKIARNDNGEFIFLRNAQGQKAISKLWWILIQNDGTGGPIGGAGVVIVMHNKPFTVDNNQRPNMDIEDRRNCSSVVCRQANILELLPSFLHVQYGINFIYCCHPRFITEIFELEPADGLLTFPPPQ